MSRDIRAAIPLEPGPKERLLERFTTVIRATVKGNILVAAAQGALGGLAFWVLGVHAPMLWGVVMAFLSLLPAVGAALIWVPVALYLLAIGQVWQGLGLIAFGVFVIGLIDNVLRPILVGKDTAMPDYVVLIVHRRRPGAVRPERLRHRPGDRRHVPRRLAAARGRAAQGGIGRKVKTSSVVSDQR